MFDILKKKLKKIVSSISEKIEKKPEEKKVEMEKAKPKSREKIIKKEIEKIKKIKPKIIEEVKQEIIRKIPSEKEIEKKLAKPKKGITEKFLEKVVKKIVEKKISEDDLRPVLKDLEVDLIEADVAYEVVEKIKSDLINNLVDKSIRRGKEKEYVLNVIRQSLLEILSTPKIDLEEIIKRVRKENKPALFLFLGFNGTGKSLTLAKLGFWLRNKGYKVLVAAGDTFRAAAIDQLEEYSKKAGLQVIKQEYGADSCAVIFDARKAAEARRFDVVLADTAGRSHTDKNLMEELAKICRVNKPDLKILVLDSLTGSDVINQFEFFDKAVGIDAIIFSKVDVNEKGGNILSICYNFKKPILFLGNGQNLNNLMEYEPNSLISSLLS
ncbi:MAG: signal recognition particle-docking protein FtsY [Candidatus Aenigmatarchaeota archaeon]